MILAARQSNIEAIRLLLANGASTNTSATFGGGYTLLASAARKGSLETLKVLVEEGGARIKGSAALQAAAMMGRVDVLRYLLDAPGDGASLDEVPTGKPFVNGTALWMAVAHKKADSVKFLLERGADVSIRGKDQRGLVEMAMKESGEGSAIVELLKTSCGSQ